jgi:hypothetical protein
MSIKLKIEGFKKKMVSDSFPDDMIQDSSEIPENLEEGFSFDPEDFLDN